MSDVATMIRMMPPDEQQNFLIWLAVHRPTPVRDGLRAWRIAHDRTEPAIPDIERGKVTGDE